jgi:polar amino acid transport system permease protein
MNGWSAFFDPDLFMTGLSAALSEGLANTIILAGGAIVLGTLIGALLSLAAVSRFALLRLFATVYVDIFRGLPSILTIVLIGLGLPLAGIDIFGRNQFAYGILGLGIVSAAYVAEILRSGIQGVDRGQYEAARAIGLSDRQLMYHIVFPQAVRRVLPALTNEFIVLIKDSSLIFVLGLQAGERDVYRIGANLSQQYSNYAPLVAAGVVYLALTIPLTRFVNWLDRSLKRAEGSLTEEKR